MKSSSTGFCCILLYLYLAPLHGLNVEDPEIFQISNPLPTIDNKVGVQQLGGMISSFPRGRLILARSYLTPEFSRPVENVNGIESSLVGTSTPEHDYAIIVSIIVQRTVTSVRGNSPECFYFNPLHGSGVVHPQVIHVYRIYIINQVPAYPPNKTSSSPITQQLCPHRGDGLAAEVLFTGFHICFSIISLNIRIMVYFCYNLFN